MSGDTAFVCFGVAPLGNDWLDYPLRAETGCINHLVLLVEELAGAGTRAVSYTHLTLPTLHSE